MISKKVISNLNVLGLTMLIYILSRMNSTSIITKYFYMIIMQIIIKESMFIQRTCAQQAPAATYSASAVERATEFCFLEDHETRQLPRN